MALTLADSIRSSRDAAGVALMPFVAAGYPSVDASVEILKALDLPGVGAIEVGIPFSDPTADGPVIQAAFADALAGGFRLNALFAALAAARADVAKPLVAMVSYSIAYRYGLDRFLADARSAGFAGLLFPDLPPPEAQSVCGRVRDAGLDTVLLVAPTTTPRRRAEIATLCSGFVYYLSVSGVTGDRATLPTDLEANLRELRSAVAVPVCVGFGIGQRKHVEQLAGIADGAIVGTALVRVVREHAAEPPGRIAQAVRAACEVLAPTATS